MKKKIGFKVIALVTVVITLMMVVVGLRVVGSERAGFTQALMNKGQSLAKFMAAVALPNLLVYDIATLQAYIEQISEDPEILYAAILVEDEKPLASHLDPEAARALGLDQDSELSLELFEKMARMTRVLEIEKPILNEGSSMGRVKVGLTKVWLEARIQHQVRMIVFVGLIGILSASLLIAVYVARNVVMPLNRDVQLAMSVATGDMTHEVRVDTQDELGILGNSLNVMVKDLRGTLKKIHQASAGMNKTSDQLRMTSNRLLEGANVQSQAADATSQAIDHMDTSLKGSESLLSALRDLSDDSSSAVLEMTASIEEVSKSIRVLLDSVGATSSSVTQMSSAVRMIADHTDGLSKTAERTADSANDISDTVKSVEGRTKEATQLSEKVRSYASEMGLKSVEKTLEGMEKIKEDFLQSFQIVSDLMEKSSQIGTIVNVIHEVTRQTNLLALNASIIAAQAGENGFGFGVVAGEIKELANRNAASTREISQIIESIKVGIAQAMESMKKGTKTVEEGGNISKEAYRILTQIVDSATRSFDEISQIEKAMEQQATGTNEINQAMRIISNQVQQIAGATQEHQTGVDGVMSAVGRIQDMAEQVNRATIEQTKGNRQINLGVETLLAKIHEALEMAKEQKAGSNQIVSSVVKIKQITQENRTLSSEVNVALSELLRDSELLEGEVSRFKL